MTPGRRLGVVVLLDAVGAVLLLVSAGRVWVTVVQAQPRPLPDVVTTLTGADLSGARAVGLLALAAVAALPAARGRLRPLVGLVLVVAGAAGAADALGVVAGPGAAAQAGPGSVVTGSGWPLVAAAGGALVALAGGLVVVWRRSLGGLSARYARTAPVQAAPPPWDVLDAGGDPTRRPGDD